MSATCNEMYEAERHNIRNLQTLSFHGEQKVQNRALVSTPMLVVAIHARPENAQSFVATARSFFQRSSLFQKYSSRPTTTNSSCKRDNVSQTIITDNHPSHPIYSLHIWLGNGFFASNFHGYGIFRPMDMIKLVSSRICEPF